jgi:MSHA biogenesis protein MshQ
VSPQRRHRWLALLALLLAALALLAAPAQAATYAFRSDTFGWETSSTAVTWDNTCTNFPNDDDKATLHFSGGFTFSFAGSSYASVQVYANGVLAFTSADTGFHRSYVNTQLPAPTNSYSGNNSGVPSGCNASTPGNLLLAYWNDLDPGHTSASSVTWEQKGTAPNRYVVVSWNAVYQYGTSTPYTFQVILFENGEFKYQYGNDNASGSNATIGVQVSDTDYTQYAYNSGYAANGTAIRWYVPPTTPVRLAEYRFDETAAYSGRIGEVRDASGNRHHGVRAGSVAGTVSSPAKVCRALNVPANTDATTAAIDTLVDVDATIGKTGSISLWYRANTAWGSGGPNTIADASMLADRNFTLVRLANGTLRFAVDDPNGTTTTATTGAKTYAAGTWVHITVTWFITTGSNASVARIYLNGSLSATGFATTTGALSSSLGTLFVGDSRNGVTTNSGTPNSADGVIDELRLYNYELSTSEMATDMAQTHTCYPPVDHIELRHASGSGLTCQSDALTVAACADAGCSALTGAGVSGTLTATGSGMAVNFANSGSFSIAEGASSTTVTFQQTTAGSTLLGVTDLSDLMVSANGCNFGSPSCTYTAADSGLIFDVPNHRADVANTVKVTAVKKSDGSASCTPAFASVSKPVTFKCSYANPATGSWAVRVGGNALNASNSASAACDATGRAVTLSFDSTGKASTTVQYADVGQVTLTGSYSGSGSSEAGLVMSGSDSFITAPYTFNTSGLSSGTLTAGTAFAVTVTAVNYSGAATPNFGRESPPEAVTLGFVRTSPQGSGASNGSFSGTLGSFSGGSASASNLKWTEVGKGEVSLLLASASYLGSGLHAAGASNGPVYCAAENGTCTLPTGVTAFVGYGGAGFVNTRSGVSGSIACNNTTFGDPIVGTAKGCAYVVSSGSSSASAGSAGPFKPHHFDVVATPACSASFSYGGQPFATTVTARNAGGSTTVNYDGSASTTPTYAKATTLGEPSALGLGTLSGTSLAAAAYAAGVASATPTYTFSSKTTAPQTLLLRATDSDGVSSAGYTEGSMALRSGRLRLSNAFGSAKTSLQVPVSADYWGASNWVPNSADSCTSVPAVAVALSNPRGATGATSSAASAASAITLSAGSGRLTLAAPTPGGSTLSLDIALNLGSTTADQSCLSTHPTTTGAALPWLRAQNGNCAASADRDPAARASFGLFSPETRKTVHVRDLF